MNLTIDSDDIKILYLKCDFIQKSHNLEQFANYCKQSYKQYFDRNTHNIERYGHPKTFSQWINGQIIAIN